ncbi:hypothetical protein BC777_0877 [Yoonia maricola]|uniref:Adenylate kinase family enzyme n=1 Tax=Yoonia maricola TaxID=420999 RepID=A0A2M8WM66_9RHOB|nr:hypothetical protein [Yoonia maricola]PJI92034.1 hypothetical protein BC777_0877 [Yoonia maricola]
MIKPSDFGGLFLWTDGDASGGSLIGRRKTEVFERAIVVGANGAGKTWLARQIAEQYDIPVIHNDALALLTRWQHRPQAEVASRRKMALAGDRWVLEGGPSILSNEVLNSATLVVWCDTSPGLRAWRIFRRSMYYLGRNRPEHPDGNRDWPGPRQLRFFTRALMGGARFEAAIEAALSGYGGPVVRLRTKAAVSGFLKAACQGAEGF